MKFDQLQYFVEAARRQHIGQAARFLNISPSAISHSIAALELEFGQTLFDKQGRQIKLTHHGKLLLDRAEFLLTEIGRVRDELSSDQLELRGHYRIAATHHICSQFLTPTWMKIQQANPALTGTLHSFRSGDVLARVSSGEVDLGICLSPQSVMNVEQETIHDGKLLMGFGKKHPFLKERRVEDLDRYPVIVALGAQGIESCENHPELARLKISQRISNFHDSYDTAIEAIQHSHQWTLIPDFIANANKSRIETYMPRGAEIKYRIAAIWPKYRIRTPALDQVVAEIGTRIRNAAKGT
jgi:DNA-binding transcriptional LysR family regulator